MASKMIGAIGSYSAGKEGTDKGYESASGQCCTTLTYIYGCEARMDSADKAQGENRSYADEGVKEDRGGFKIG